MSDMGDEDLLNDEEFDYESYDLGCEEEEALLEEDKEYENEKVDYGSGDDEDFKRKNVCSEKKETLSEPDEQEDILNLDIEEDFQVEDKEELVEKKTEGKFVSERSQSSSSLNITTNVPPKPQVGKRPLISMEPSDTAKTNDQNMKKIEPKFDNKRKRGVGRGNFQSRPTFGRNNMQKDRRPGRRNGTVFINPKYEGFVHISDNNARLAWDNNPNYSQNSSQSVIEPWALGNNGQSSQDTNVLLNNLVGIAASFSQPPNLLQLPPPPQNSVLNFEPPPNVYANQVQFQGVPNIHNSSYNNPNPHVSQWNESYNSSNQSQVPPPQTSFQNYYPSGSQQFNNPPPSTNYNYYSNNSSNPPPNYDTQTRRWYTNTNTNDDRNMSFKLTNNTRLSGPSNFDFRRNSSFKPEFRKQFNYPSENFGYNVKNTYQNKTSFNQNPRINQTYNNYKFENKNVSNRSELGTDGNMKSNSYQQNMNQRDTKFEISQNTYNSSYNRDESYSAQNRPFRPLSMRNESPGQSAGDFQRGNYNINRNFTSPRITRQVQNNNEVKNELSEKRIKTAEQGEVEQSKQESSNTNFNVDEEEDEEMRLYRLKIEEQKREREKVLKMKEERRRMALLQQQNEENPVTTSPKNADQQQVTIPESSRPKIYQQQQQQRPINQIPVLTAQQLPNLTFKISNNLQRKVPPVEKPPLSSGTSSSDSFLSDRAVSPTSADTIPRKELFPSNFMSNRVVVVKGKSDNNEKSGVLSTTSVVKTVNADSESPDVGQGLSSFFNNRKVLKKDNSLLSTRLVVISNLSASTTEDKLVALTRGIGDIEKLRMDKQERQATILFKSVATAHAFFKKYRRHMLDLSMIEVKLKPML